MSALTRLRERTVAGLHATLADKVATLVAPDVPILDVGCGTGAWLQRLGRLGFTNLQGADLDTAQFALDGIRVHVSDLDGPRWLPGEQQFRLVTAVEVIEHLQNIGNFFANANRYLAADGHLLLTTPNVHSIHARLRYLLTGDMKQFGRIGDSTHLYPLLSATMLRLAARHGFEPVEQWGFPANGDAVGARRWVNVVCSILRRVLPEPIPGDVYCVLLRKT
jgi:2-polyprenyl-3-methyl-5-hydroxy-6-metoxy-1,4-benzoquinol methylase